MVTPGRATPGAMFNHVLWLILVYLHPLSAARVSDLINVAGDIASTDATEVEAELLAAICIHESRCTPKAKGLDGSVGAFQVHGGPGTAEALRRVRWSYGICGDLSLYAGCGRCGACPEVVDSLTDPSLPRK